jgi:hypothetical protein
MMSASFAFSARGFPFIATIAAAQFAAAIIQPSATSANGFAAIEYADTHPDDNQQDDSEAEE